MIPPSLTPYPEINYVVDESSNSYPLASSEDIVVTKANNTIKMTVSDTFNDKFSLYQTVANMSSYATTQTLINDYATQLELSEKVDITVFENQLDIARLNAIQNSNIYTDGKISDLSAIYLTTNNASITYAPKNASRYIIRFKSK